MIEWTGWSECINGQRTNEQYIAIDQSGPGLPCGEIAYISEGKLSDQLKICIRLYIFKCSYVNRMRGLRNGYG